MANERSGYKASVDRHGLGAVAGMAPTGRVAVGVLMALVLCAGRAVAFPQVEEGSKPQESGESAVGQRQPETPGKAGADLSSEESLTRFRQLLEKRPFHGPAFEGLVKGYVDQARLKDLVAEYVAKTAALPDDVSLRIIAARLHLRAGDAAEAGKILDGIEQLPPDMARLTSDLLVLKAQVYQKSGDNAAAETVLKNAIDAAASVSEKLRLGEALADLYLRDDRKDDATRSLVAMAAEFPDNYLHQRRIAGALEQRGLHEAAVERYRAILPMVKAEVDRRCEVLRELGQALEKLGKRDEAIEAYVEAVGLLASDHWLQKDLHERIVALYRAGNRLADLAAYCEGQIKRSPEQTGMRVLLADVQAAMGQPDLGKRTLAEAVGLFPKDTALSQKRVQFLERLGDIEGVSAEYQRAIGQNPGDNELYIAYGQSLANSKQIEGARNQWRHVLATKVDDATLALRLGALFETYELYDDASEAYERAIAASPKQPDAYGTLSRLWLVRGDAVKAVETLDRMGVANPTDGAVQAARAQGLRNLGKLPEALAAITAACELMPDQIRFLQTRSELLVQNGQLEDALGVRRAMIDKMTNPVQRAEAIGTLVSMYSSADRLAAIKEQEKKKLADVPGDAVALLILARAADTERDFPAMRGYLEALLSADPGQEAALQQMAKLQDATGDINAAVETYTKLIQGHPQRARPFYEAVVDLKLRYGDRAGAIQTLEGMAKGDPGNAATQSAVADQLVRMGDQERALPYFEAALHIQQDKHDTRLEYGKALVDAGRLEDALREFRRAATQRADMDRAVEAIGKMHETASQLGKLEELIDELQQQVEADPSDALVARALAHLLVRELEYGRALDLLDLVLKHNPRDVDLALGRAEVLRRLARYDEAVEGYQSVLRFPQIDRDYVLGELGKTYFESGQVDQARRLWRQVQNKLYAGSLLKNNGLVEEAIAAFEEGIRLKPDEYALHRNLIVALEAAGKTAEALNAAQRLLDLEPGNVMNVERLAEAYLKSGNRSGAAAVAARLFSAGVGVDRSGGSGGAGSGAAYQSFASAMYQSQYAQMGGSYGYYGRGQSRSNLDRGVEFFTRNGLNGELEEVLTAQIAAQPDNALLKDKAAGLFMSQLNKPELAMSLLRELETDVYPVEQQQWLGQCSQRDYMRIRQFNLIASKPALRDRELAALDAKKAAELSRDEALELAIIRSALGAKDKAVELLIQAVTADPGDVLALGMLTDMLVAAEKFTDAEPHARRLVGLLADQREKMHADTVERVRRDFVRSLPVEFQLRVNETLLSDIADKWTLGQGWSWWGAESTQAVGFLRAKLTLGTICAETGRMEEARGIWRGLAPSHGPDVDRWTMLGDTAQVHKQEDLAFEFYQQALRSAKTLAGDPLLQQVYSSGSAQRSWYGEQGSIDKAFGSIVETFSRRNSLVELHDFLRDTDQEQRARRVAEQYKLGASLKPLYEQRVAEAAEEFRKSSDGRLRASPAYFAQVCKLAELYDREGRWEEAQKVYAGYLADFPDELGLLTLLGEVAEARQKTDEAIEWEKKVLDCKARLAKSARDWAQRELALTPGKPQPLGSRIDPWSWQNRWSRNRWSYGQTQELDRWPSFMRLAQLYLVAGNPIAAADAMQRGVAEAGGRRDAVVRQAIELIQQRQLTAKMGPVIRTLAVYAPADEQVQLAFAESLEAGGQKALALEVCNRMLRRGLSGAGVLAEVRRRVQSLSPDKGAPEVTLASLEAEAAGDSANLKARLRLAKAYYYSLRLDRAQEALGALVKEAPHLEDVHDLLVEAYTLRGDSDKLIEALKSKIDRLTDDRQRRTTRWRLVDELLSAGRTEEALAVVKDLGDPRDPRSYTRIGTLLNYFGRHDEAIACLEKAGKSKGGNPWGGREGADFSVAQCLAMRGDYAKAAEKVVAAVEEQSRQQVQMGGAYGMYGMYGNEGNPFGTIEHFLALYPELAKELGAILEARRAAAPGDPQTIKILMAFQRSMGRSDKADELLEQVAEGGAADQTLVVQQVERAVKRLDFQKAITIARKFISQTPKAQIPPGMPAQYAGAAFMQSPRTLMLCKLGDVYWDMGDKDKAFETYKQLVDQKVDETRLAYATICLVRGRTEEARKLVDEALAAQEVKPPPLLQFRAFIAAMDGQLESAFDALALAAAPGAGNEEQDVYGRGGSPMDALAMLARQGNLVERFVPFVRDRIQKNPDDWASYSSLAEVYRQSGHPKEAMAVLDEAATVTTLTQQAVQERLNRVSRIAPVEELIPLYERLVELSERNVESAPRGGWNARGGDPGASGQEYRDRLGGLLWEKGEAEKAEHVWAERMNAQKSETHLKLGRLYVEHQAWGKAGQEFERATDLDPDSLGAQWAAASEAYRRGDRGTALRHMLECFQRGAADAEGSSRYQRYSYPGDENDQSHQAEGMSEWAAVIAGDPGLATYLAEPALAGRAEECRLMLAALTGDWATLDKSLKEKIDGGTTDPLIWRLWAKSLRRKGDWAGAAGALDFLRRVKLTTIGEHRERLKLVLAGKQLKEAAAGVRQAPPGSGPMPPGAAQAFGYQSFGSPYGDEGRSGEGSVLPSIYIKLGDFARAERCYLLSSGGDGAEGRLPALAMLMWEQKAKDRALELMRMALAAPTDRYSGSGGRMMLPRYAAMLSEAGQTGQAIELLIRAYRWDSSGEAQNGYYQFAGYGNRGQEFEQGQEQSVAGALYSMLMKTGAFDETLKQLGAQSAADPADTRLAKLVLSLLKQGRRWPELRDSLAAQRAARPGDLALTLEQFHAECQMEHWDACLPLLDELRRIAPRQMGRWTTHEAFIRLARDEVDKAVAAIEPELGSLPDEDEEGQSAPQAAVTLLAAAGRHDRLTTYLTQRKESGELDESGTELLARLLIVQKQWEPALQLTLEQFWRSEDELRETGRWWRVLKQLSAQAGGSPGVLTPSQERPADAALMTLLSQGPGEGVRAFEALCTGPDATLESQRGLVFAALLAGDDALALKADTRLLEWLSPRRLEMWYPRPAPTLQHQARKAVERMAQAGTGQVAMSMGYGTQLSQVGEQMGQRESLVTYDALWGAHQKLHRALLARAGDVGRLRALVRDQARTLSESQNPYGSSRSSYSYYGGYPGGFSPAMGRAMGYYNGGEDRDEGNADWGSTLRRTLWEAGSLGALHAEYESLGQRVPAEEQPIRNEAAAATGQDAAATALRRARAEGMLAKLRATDVPDLGASGQDSWRWYWYGYGGNGDEAVQHLGAALRTQTDDDPENPDVSGRVHGEGDSLSDLALADPEVERMLVRLTGEIGPGWGSARSLAELVGFYRARRDPQKVIELLERTNTPEEMTRSPLVESYAWACFKTHAADKLESVLVAAAKAGPALENEVAIARLVLLRQAGQDAQATEMESALLAKCRRQTPNPHRPAAILIARARTEDGGWSEQWASAGPWGSRTQRWYPPGYNGQDRIALGDLSTITELAAGLGVRYESGSAERGATVEAVRRAYSGHGLHAHAARLLDREIADALTPEQTFELGLEKASELLRAGNEEAAHQTARELESALSAELKHSTDQGEIQWRLGRLYMSRAFGPNYSKALEAVEAARTIDPAYDPLRIQSIRCLYELAKYREAWDAWRLGSRVASGETLQEPTVFYASLSASKSGQKEAGKALARRALYRYPDSPLAKKAREILDEH
jgi:tetratricopeptide (TPR) repeat protein